MYKIDSTSVSLLWGRTGAAILLLVSVGLGIFGYTFGEDDQVAVYEIIASILTALGLGQVVVSKVRESNKVEQAKVDKIKGE